VIGSDYLFRPSCVEMAGMAGDPLFPSTLRQLHPPGMRSVVVQFRRERDQIGASCRQSMRVIEVFVIASDSKRDHQISMGRGSARFCSERIHLTTRPWPALLFNSHTRTNKSWRRDEARKVSPIPFTRVWYTVVESVNRVTVVGSLRWLRKQQMRPRRATISAKAVWRRSVNVSDMAALGRPMRMVWHPYISGERVLELAIFLGVGGDASGGIA
jgi:hypothetical protein